VKYSGFDAGRYASRQFLAVFLVAYFPICHAQDNTPSEQVFLQDFPVVLSASRLSQPLSEAPNAMTVIDRKMIKSSGFRTISDLFRLVPGMYVGAVNGHTPVVGYHGSTEEYSRRMQVLIDGRSVYLPPFSTVDWEDIPLNIDDIERIEVVRGPAAASFGANSLQGVINIITRDAAGENGTMLNMTKGSFGVADLAAHMGNTGTNMDYRVTLAHREDSGYGSGAMFDGKKTNQANLRTNYHPIGNDNFDFQLGYSDSTRGLGIVGKPDDIFRYENVVSSFQQLTWQHALQNGDDFQLHYYHIKRDLIDDALASANGSNVIAQTVADRNDVELQHTLQLWKNNRMVWGLGLRTDYTSSQEFFKAPYTLHQSRAFAHDEWRFTPSFLMNVGAMVEDDGLGHVNTSPRLAFNYHVTPQHTLRVSTSVAYRTPAVYEEKVDIYGTFPGQSYSSGYVSQGGLMPEKTLSREIGYLGEFDAAGISLDVRAYDDHVSDMIFVDPAATGTGWPFGFANLYAANYHGYESTLKYHWNDKGNVIVNLSRQFVSCEVTGTATNPLYVSAYLQGYMNDCPLSVPNYSSSILLTQQLNADLQFSAGYYHQDGIKMIANNNPQSMMNRVDLRIAQSFGKSGQPGSGEVALVVQNAFQDDFTKYSTTQETDNILFQRRAYIYATYIY
jgi:iron complex outermembrane receptor protein